MAASLANSAHTLCCESNLVLTCSNFSHRYMQYACMEHKSSCGPIQQYLYQGFSRMMSNLNDLSMICHWQCAGDCLHAARAWVEVGDCLHAARAWVEAGDCCSCPAASTENTYPLKLHLPLQFPVGQDLERLLILRLLDVSYGLALQGILVPRGCFQDCNRAGCSARQDGPIRSLHASKRT